MKLELTIQSMFDEYPTLFKERSDCLDHLFCTIGNGYHWSNGELCDNDDEGIDVKHLESNLVNGKAYQHNKLSLRAESQLYEEQRIAEGWYEEYHKKYPDEVIDNLKEIRQNTIMKMPDDVYHKRPRDKRWSFYLSGYCTQYAYLFNYPSNIKPDWLAGIEECKAMLIEDGYDVEHPHEHPIDTKANWEENIAAYKKREWMVT